MAKHRYTILFDRSHWQWVVEDSEFPDTDHGYFYKKADATRVRNMLNERLHLLAGLEAQPEKGA